MSQVTGAMLRELRLWAEVGLRAVARRSSGNVRLSDGHLSRVERGPRPVTLAVLAAYERALGMRIDPYTIKDLTSGSEPDDADRHAFQATVANLAAGTPTGRLGGEGEQRLLRDAMYRRVPQRITATDATHLERAALTLRGLDLRHGGELTTQMAGQLLHWAAGLRDASMTGQVRRRWHAALSRLATWAAWSAHDACQRPVARALSVLALDAAVTADEPDLRAHVPADIAAGHNHHGHPVDALHTIRLADGDERNHPAIQTMLHVVRARAYAALGERDPAEREVRLVEHVAATVDQDAVPEWLGGWHPAHVPALCGHAYASLARECGSLADLALAHDRLTDAARRLTPVRPRAAALCLTHLALAYQRCGNPDGAVSLTRQAAHLATDLRSARVTRDLAALQAGTDGGGPPRAG